jgi:hypothetical protein
MNSCKAFSLFFYQEFFLNLCFTLTKALTLASVQPRYRNPHKKAAALLQMPETCCFQQHGKKHRDNQNSELFIIQS